MAFDGAFLSQLIQELKPDAIGARVDKIHQPSREEIVVTLRWPGGVGRLLISAGANSPRLHFTTQVPENPPAPPMFCMLLRKHLSSAKLLEIRQIQMDRMVHLVFETSTNWDLVKLTLAVEIMGRHSNIILVDQNNRIVDAIKRIDTEMSSVRPVLPGIPFTLPPCRTSSTYWNTPRRNLRRGARRTDVPSQGAGRPCRICP
ncbi:MAG: NFACT family protein [Oscillospiraceae bacterium]